MVAVKGTFAIPDDRDEPVLAEEQVPLVHTDVFTGEPGFSAPLYEIDYAPRKPRCDVLLNGNAYAPGGEPTERVTVSLKVGSMSKSFDVVGNRVWQAGMLYLASSKPEPFTVMPISYDNAFGGVDRTQEDPAKHHWYPTNHAGVGYYENSGRKGHRRQAAPEHRGDGPEGEEIRRGKYRPMAFGPVGRSWQPRVRWRGRTTRSGWTRVPVPAR